MVLDQHAFKDGDLTHPQAGIFKVDATGKLAWAFDIGGSSAVLESVALVPGTGDVVVSGLFVGTANLGAGDIKSASSGTAPSFFAARRGN